MNQIETIGMLASMPVAQDAIAVAVFHVDGTVTVLAPTPEEGGAVAARLRTAGPMTPATDVDVEDRDVEYSDAECEEELNASMSELIAEAAQEPWLRDVVAAFQTRQRHEAESVHLVSADAVAAAAAEVDAGLAADAANQGASDDNESDEAP